MIISAFHFPSTQGAKYKTQQKMKGAKYKIVPKRNFQTTNRVVFTYTPRLSALKESNFKFSKNIFPL